MKTGSRKRTEISSGRRLTKILRLRCATPPAPQAIPRECCIRIAPTCSTRSWPTPGIRWAQTLGIQCCRWFRCSTPTAGASRSRHLRWAPSWCCSAMPRSMIKAFVDMGVTVRHAWGMTEMSPIGTLAALKPPFAELEGDARLDVLQTQGYPPFGVQMKITDDAGKELPWDGKTFGRLKVAGPAVSKGY